MKKFFIFSIVATTLLITVMSNFVYAEDKECAACSTTSPYIDAYIALWNELISAFLTFANTESSVLNGQDDSFWSTNAHGQENFSPDFIRGLWSIVDNLNQTTQSIVSVWYVAGLIGIEEVQLNSFKSIVPMLGWQAILRDWNKIGILNQKLLNTITDLWNNGVFIRLWFKDWWKERIGSILQKYSQWSTPIFYDVGNAQWEVIKKSASFQPIQVLWWLWSINQGVRTAIGFWNASELSWSFMNGYVQISPQFQEALWPWWYYSCAKGVSWMSCSSTVRKNRDNYNAIVKDTKNQTNDAMKTVKMARKRLSWFWSKNSDAKSALQERTNELLRWQNGWQGVRNNNGKPIVQWFWDAYKTVKDEIITTNPFAWFTLKERGDTKPFVVWDIAQTLADTHDKDYFISVGNAMLKTAENNWMQSIFSDVTPITRTFPLLTQELVTAKFIIDGTTSESIVNNLWRACDLQCSNAWWTCWYTP